ncbi:MAG: hypothetical protein ACFE85_01835 [Candidatus Hodarchaeota archaeon]
MRDINQIVNNIKEEINLSEPSYSRIETNLRELWKIKTEHQSISDSEFFEIVGESFSKNPELFMKNNFISSFLPYYKDREKKNQMARYIIEKYSLYDGEKILFECDADISMVDSKSKAIVRVPVIISIDYGHLIITNNRIIAQGQLEVGGGRLGGVGGPSIDGFIYYLSGKSRRKTSMKGMMDASTTQDLPCYGYEFPIKPFKGLIKPIIARLRKKYEEKPKKSVGYFVKVGESTFNVVIKRYKKEEYLDKLYEILSKVEVSESESVKTNVKDKKL